MSLYIKIQLLVSFLASFFPHHAFSDAKQFYYEKKVFNNIQFEKSTGSYEGVFKQKIDHNNKVDERVFNQRYYINSTYAKNLNSPVFFYICGEAACEKSRVERGQIVDMAIKNQGHIVALEHRYYGKSWPFKDLKTENLKYLSIAQAIGDLYHFQLYLVNKKKLAGKYIMIGGSYPGNLAAVYRIYYPSMSIGALASSAPVYAKENFFEYDAHLAHVVDGRCLKNIHEVNRIIEESLDNSNEFDFIKEKFGANEIVDSIDFLYLIADVAAAAIQYGMKEDFCKAIDYERPLDGYAKFANHLFKSWNINAVDLTFQSAYNDSPEGSTEHFGMRQWLYQSCTEYGYWQVANSYPDTARSKKIDLNYHRKICEKVFGIKRPAKTFMTNLKYYYPLFFPTTRHIMFTNGSDDPWMNLSLSEEMSKLNHGLDIMTIPSQAHCDDLRSSNERDSDELKVARAFFLELIESWL